jgi:DNA polymerase-3 subunit alpha
MSDFVHLHLHTEYSLLDGLARITKGDSSPLIEAVKKHGMKAVAVTDHGNLYGAVIFAKQLALSDSGIKGIYGCEFYFADDMFEKNPERREYYHLIILAKNNTGYKNLMKLSSASFIDGFYIKPRIDLNLLKKYSEGLICLSACIAGKIPRLILADRYDEARAHALELQSIFGDDFYIELQDHGIPEEKMVNPVLYKLASEIGAKVVATNDVHYLEPEDADLQDTMICINTVKKKNDLNRMRFDDQLYFKSEEEMKELFKWCPEAIYNTVEIADKCNVDFVIEAREHYMPLFNPNEPLYQEMVKSMPKEYEARIAAEFDRLDADAARPLDRSKDTSSTYLRKLTYTLIGSRYKQINTELDERMEYELSTIIELGFDNYFLVVWDFINFAKRNGIPVGPGRGSGAGSLVAYSLHITDIDPIRFSLIFERFLNRERVSMPDFDIDFCENRRGEVIKYVQEKYGAKNVSQIIAFSTMSAKAAIKDVARVYDVPFQEANDWVKTLPYGKITIEECLGRNPKKSKEDKDMAQAEFIELYNNNPTARNIIDVAIKLEGLPRQPSVHAAGVVICRDDITEHCPLQRNNTDITTQFDKNQIEGLGLLKMDFLGLTTLTDISDALELVKESTGKTVNFEELGDTDRNVYDLIGSGDTVAVFQLESSGMTTFMAKLKPDNIEEITAGIALYRPGPMRFMDQFLDGKWHPESIHYYHPKLEPILNTTHGCIIYQEQVMEIAREIAGYSYGGADVFRRAMGKKDEATIKKNKHTFIYGQEGKVVPAKQPGKPPTVIKGVDGAIKRGMSEQAASGLYDQIEGFAKYAFNKSHAAAYSVLTYRTAWLKCYYLAEYMTAVINNRLTRTDKLKVYISYLKSKNIIILQPDINRSKVKFSIENGNIRFGLLGAKNVGEAALAAIIKEREKNGPFKDLYDFIERASRISAGEDEGGKIKGAAINKRMVESLIKGGAFDSMGLTRSSMLACYEQIMDIVQRAKKSQASGQISLFDMDEVESGFEYPRLKEMDKFLKLSLEKEVLGIYVSAHPLDEYAAGYSGFTTRALIRLDSDEAADLNGEEEKNGQRETAARDYFSEAEDEEGSEERLSYDTSLHNKTVTFGGIVQSAQQGYSQKSKKLMLSGMFEDIDGSIKYMLFGDAVVKYGDLIKSGAPIKITGQLAIREGEQPVIFVSEAVPWEKPGSRGEPDMAEARVNGGEKAASSTLIIKITDEAQAKELVPILKKYPGPTEIFALFTDGGKKPFRQKVNITSDLIFDLSDRIGRTNLKLTENN